MKIFVLSTTAVRKEQPLKKKKMKKVFVLSTTAVRKEGTLN
jgi:hypothetical protein